MKANELRIGNWVMGNKPYQIGVSNLVTMSWYEKTNKLSYCEPIPLTEEWLVKFGFEDDYPYIVLNGKLKIKNGVWFYKYHLLEIELRYVHQLQNLYFSLTREELTA